MFDSSLCRKNGKLFELGHFKMPNDRNEGKKAVLWSGEKHSERNESGKKNGSRVSMMRNGDGPGIKYSNCLVRNSKCLHISAIVYLCLLFFDDDNDDLVCI